MLSKILVEELKQNEIEIKEIASSLEAIKKQKGPLNYSKGTYMGIPLKRIFEQFKRVIIKELGNDADFTVEQRLYIPEINTFVVGVDLFNVKKVKTPANMFFFRVLEDGRVQLKNKTAVGHDGNMLMFLPVGYTLLSAKYNPIILN